MQELIEQLTDKYGISEDQATGIIDTVKNYFASGNAATEGTDSETKIAEQPEAKENFLQKATNFAEDKGRGVKEKAEELFGEAGNKIKNLFH